MTTNTGRKATQAERTQAEAEADKATHAVRNGDALLTIAALATMSDDEHKARAKALREAVTEAVKANTADDITGALRTYADGTGISVMEEAERRATQAVTVSKRARQALAQAVRDVWLNMTEARTAGVVSITQADVASTLGVTQPTISRAVKAERVRRVKQALKARGLTAEEGADIGEAVNTATAYRAAMAEAATAEALPEWAKATGEAADKAADKALAADPATALLALADKALKASHDVVRTEANAETLRRAQAALAQAARHLSSVTADKADKAA
jgi:transcriptional regulator with XRE-family HTH domain